MFTILSLPMEGFFLGISVSSLDSVNGAVLHKVLGVWSGVLEVEEGVCVVQDMEPSVLVPCGVELGPDPPEHPVAGLV